MGDLGPGLVKSCSQLELRGQGLRACPPGPCCPRLLAHGSFICFPGFDKNPAFPRPVLHETGCLKYISSCCYIQLAGCQGRKLNFASPQPSLPTSYETIDSVQSVPGSASSCHAPRPWHLDFSESSDIHLAPANPLMGSEILMFFQRRVVACPVSDPEVGIACGEGGVGGCRISIWLFSDREQIIYKSQKSYICQQFKKPACE